MSEKKLSKELQITSSKLAKMSPNELEEFAEEKAKVIIEKIELSTQMISEAKDAAEIAGNMKSGWFGKTRKKSDATADAVIATNEAVAEMNELLQESIRFTCISLDLAKAMSEHMSALIVNGFKNREGKIIKLSADSEEQALYIIQQAETFAKNQLEVEMKQTVQDSKIDNLAEKVSSNARRLNEKDKIDAEQSKRLEELGALLNNKDLVDQKQEEAISKNSEAIKVLFDYTRQKDILDKKQSEEIELLKTCQPNRMCIIAICLSVISILVSVTAIVLQVLR